MSERSPRLKIPKVEKTPPMHIVDENPPEVMKAVARIRAKQLETEENSPEVLAAIEAHKGKLKPSEPPPIHEEKYGALVTEPSVESVGDKLNKEFPRIPVSSNTNEPIDDKTLRGQEVSAEKPVLKWYRSQSGALLESLVPEDGEIPGGVAMYAPLEPHEAREKLREAVTKIESMREQIKIKASPDEIRAASTHLESPATLNETFRKPPPQRAYKPVPRQSWFKRFKSWWSQVSAPRVSPKKLPERLEPKLAVPSLREEELEKPEPPSQKVLAVDNRSRNEPATPREELVTLPDESKMETPKISSEPKMSKEKLTTLADEPQMETSNSSELPPQTVRVVEKTDDETKPQKKHSKIKRIPGLEARPLMSALDNLRMQSGASAQNEIASPVETPSAQKIKEALSHKEKEEILERLKVLKADVHEIEYKAGHPVPGAMKVNYEPQVLALEVEIYKLEEQLGQKKAKRPETDKNALTSKKVPLSEGRESLVTLAEESQMETPVLRGGLIPPEVKSALEARVEEWKKDDPHDSWDPNMFATFQEKQESNKYPGGLYDGSRWTGNGRHTPSRNPLPNRPLSEIYPPKWALERVAREATAKSGTVPSMIEAPKKQEKRPSFFARIFGRKSRTRTLAGALAATIGGQELSRGAEFSHKTEPPPGFEEMVKYPDDVVAQYKTVFGEDPPEKVSAVDLAWRIHTLASTMEGSGSGTESPRNLVSVKSLAPRRTQRPRDIRPKELRESTSLNSEEGPATDLKTGQSEVFGKAPITPVEVKSLARVPKRPEAKNVPPALSRDEVAETRALNTAELERVRRVVAEHTARIAQTNTPISVSALKTETKPRNIEGTMREVVKESMPYGSSPKAFHNKNKLFIDPDQPRLFKDMKGQLVAYGGNFDKRSERAIKRITEDPTAKVQILVDEQVERPYVGEYVFDSATQRPKVVPLSMKDLKPSFWSRIGSIFKKRPKIDPDMFVQEVA